jgi:hypothetical protein
VVEQARSLGHIKQIARNLRRTARAKGETLPHFKSLEQAAQQCGYASYNKAVIALPEKDPTPVPRS